MRVLQCLSRASGEDALYLTLEEERMLRGDFGEVVAEAMRILVSLGEAYGAEKMVEISSAHLVQGYVSRIGDAGIAFFENLAKRRANVKVFTTLNTMAYDRKNWKAMGIINEDYCLTESRILRALEKIGCQSLCTCTPFYYSFPRFGEHISWAESNAVIFANSVLGARCSREGGPTACMAALTGRTPLYSFHLRKNRLGKIWVNVDVELEGTCDFGVLGYCVGKMAANRVPVLEGISEKVRVEDLVELGSALATSGAIGMYHVVGVTPEARSKGEAFGDTKPEEKIVIGRTELKEVYEELTTKRGRIDWVVLGCPHYTLRQIAEVTKLLGGRKIHDGVRLWIHTSEGVYALAERLGYADSIRKAGGLLTVDICMVGQNPLILKTFGRLVIATDSAKQAFYIGPARGWHDTILGSTKDCLEAAIAGRFEG